VCSQHVFKTYWNRAPSRIRVSGLAAEFLTAEKYTASCKKITHQYVDDNCKLAFD